MTQMVHYQGLMWPPRNFGKGRLQATSSLKEEANWECADVHGTRCRRLREIAEEPRHVFKQTLPYVHKFYKLISWSIVWRAFSYPSALLFVPQNRYKIMVFKTDMCISVQALYVTSLRIQLEHWKDEQSHSRIPIGIVYSNHDRCVK